MTELTQNQRKALRSAFLEGMSRMASTVSVVATDGPAGRAGATVSSQVSVSADTDRPTLLVCLHRESVTEKVTQGNGVFSVNCLAQDQLDLAKVFAGRSERGGDDKFEQGDWVRGVSGSPLLVPALATFDCEVVEIVSIGQHSVVFGEVRDITVGRPIEPLVYANREFARVRPIEFLKALSAA